MAKAVGLSHSSVQRIWQAPGLKPHLVNTFKISRDKHFTAKVADVAIGKGTIVSQRDVKKGRASDWVRWPATST